jgi:hypothetical protein
MVLAPGEMTTYLNYLKDNFSVRFAWMEAAKYHQAKYTDSPVKVVVVAPDSEINKTYSDMLNTPGPIPYDSTNTGNYKTHSVVVNPN